MIEHRFHGESMLNELLTLAAQSPTGLGDARAADKLLHERDELMEALAAGDRLGALTEAADAAYFAAKHLQYVGELLGITVEDVLALGIAKYQQRMKLGVKDDDAERQICLQLLKERRPPEER
jgi:phosphoribosyl-ATP pyrophosphohydrolase